MAGTALAGFVGVTFPPTNAEAACAPAAGGGANSWECAGPGLGESFSNLGSPADDVSVVVLPEGATFVSAGNGVELDGSAGAGVNVSYIETGTASIVAAGHGVVAQTLGGGSATITQIAGSTIMSGGDGMRVHTESGPITIVSDGSIIASLILPDETIIGGDGISAVSGIVDPVTGAVTGGGDVSVALGPTSSIVAEQRGVVAQTVGTGTSTVLAAGVIRSGGDGIFAQAAEGKVTVTNHGEITTAPDGFGNGVRAETTSGGAITVLNDLTGVITAGGDGVRAVAVGTDASGTTGAILVTNNGSINAPNFSGIVAQHGDTPATTGMAVGGIDIAIENTGSVSGGVADLPGGGVVGNGGDGIRATTFSSGGVIIENKTLLEAAQPASIRGDFHGVVAENFGGGNVTISNSGVISALNSASSPDSAAVRAYTTGADGGAVSVHNKAAGQIEAPGGHGIVAINDGPGLAGTVNVNVLNEGGIGSLAAPVAYSGILAENVGAGAISVRNTGEIFAAGDARFPSAAGISAGAFGGGNIGVDNVGAIDSVNGWGILAESQGGGAVVLANEGSIRAGKDGVAVLSDGGGVGVNNALGATIDAGLHGVNVVNAATSASLPGALNPVEISNHGGIVAGADGVRAENVGGFGVDGGLVGVGNYGTIVAGANGVTAMAVNGGDAMVVNGQGATIDAQGDGVFAQTLGANGLGDGGKTTVLNMGAINGVFTGVAALHGNADTPTGAAKGGIDVEVQNAGTVTGGVEGVRAQTFSGGEVLVQNQAGGSISGDYRAIVADNVGGGVVRVENQGALTAANAGFLADAAGILAHTTGAAGGSAYVLNAAGGEISSGGQGVRATNDGLGTSAYMSNTGILGVKATDVHVINQGVIGLDASPVALDGVFAESGGAGAVIVENTNRIATLGNPVAIPDNRVPGSGKAAGVRAYGGGDVGVANTGAISSVNGDGVIAEAAQGGAVRVVNAGTGTITAGGIGVVAATGLGAGGPAAPMSLLAMDPGAIPPLSVEVANLGLASIVAGGDAVRVVTSGGVLVTNENLIQSTTASAISVANFGDPTMIVNRGVLRGDGASAAKAVIAIDPNGLGATATTEIRNTGRIASNTDSPAHMAIAAGAATIGAVTVHNGGEIFGAVKTGDGDDLFHNTGEWRTSGDSFFAGGADRIDNKGRIRTVGATRVDLGAGANSIDNAGVLQVTNGGVFGAATFAATGGAMVFNNAGVVDMQNDGSHLPYNTVTIGGNFNAVGNGGQLLVDTQLGGIGSTSDRMIVNGAVTGGRTGIVVRDASPGLGAWNPFGTTIVSAQGGGRVAFYLSPNSSRFVNGVLDKGLYVYALGVGAGAGCQGPVCYTLYSAPSGRAQMLPIAVTAAQGIFQETALMWEDRQTELRDQLAHSSVSPMMASTAPAPSGKGVIAAPPPATVASGAITTWVKSVGAWTSRSNYSATWVGQTALGYNLGYNQDTWGILGGANYARGSIFGGDVNVGVLGGYLQSYVNFRQGQNWRYEGGTVGVSASYMRAGFFVDGLFKADLLRLQMTLPASVGYGDSGAGTNVDTIGGVWNAGYHLAFGPNMFIEPTATLTYSATSIGSLNQLAPLGVAIRYGSGEDFRGGFGARLGAEMPNFISSYMLQASLTGRVWDQFNSNGGRTVDILSGGVGQTLGDYTLGAVYGEMKGNLALLTMGPGLGAYVSGGAKFNDQFTTWTARGGVSYRW